MGYGAIPSNAPVKLTGRLDLYVAADAANASDANPGTAAQPLATFEAAIARINAYDEIGEGDANGIAAVIHMAAAAAGYTFQQALLPVLLRGDVAIIGDGAAQPGQDGFTVLVATTAAVAGSSTSQLVMGGGLGVNTYRGKTIEILTGAAAGDRRTIRDHTDTIVIPVRNFSAAVAATDTFRIVGPAVEIALTPLTLLVDGYGGEILSSGIWNGNPADVASLHLVNLRFEQTSTGAVRLSRSRVVFYGCEFEDPAGTTATVLDTDGSTLLLGTEWPSAACQAQLGPILTSAPSVTSWSGWGCFFVEALSQFGGGTLAGFLVGTGASIAIRGDAFVMCGGAVSGNSAGGVVSPGPGSRPSLVFGIVGGAANAPACALANASAGAAVLDIGNTSTGFMVGVTVSLLKATLTPNAGTCLRVRGGNAIYVDTSTNVTGAGNVGIDARAGGRVDLNGVTGVLGAAGNDLTVDAGATFGAAASLGAANAARLSAVNSAVIVRVN